MGMSDKQVYILLVALALVIIFGGIVFEIADRFGRLWAIITMTAANSLYFMYIVFVVRKHNVGEEQK